MMIQRSSLTFLFAVLSLASNELHSNDLDKCAPSEFIVDRPEYALTEDEKVELIEKELALALNQFDECISKIDNSAMGSSSSSSNNSSASNSSYGESSSEGGASSNGSQQASEPTPTNSVDSSNQSEPIVKSIADAGNPESGNIPPQGSESPGDIDFSDDDIVAKQIREAAIAETDPEMKELLWERYREYKGD